MGGFATKEKDTEVEERIDKGRPLALLGEELSWQGRKLWRVFGLVCRKRRGATFECRRERNGETGGQAGLNGVDDFRFGTMCPFEPPAMAAQCSEVRGTHFLDQNTQNG